jgi:hypothetical protein
VRLSDEKISHLTHVLLKGLLEKDLLTLKEEEGLVRRAMKRAITAELQVGDEMDRVVKRKIESLSRGVVEGSPEWEVLYKKFLKEEEVKRGRA